MRFRHTDSDLYRLAREQEFVRAVKEQVARNFDPFELPSIVSAITGNVQVGAKTRLSDTTVLGYALFAATLPAGHVVQESIPTGELSSINVGGADELSASPAAIQQVVSAFEHPAVVGAKRSQPAPARPAAQPAKPTLPPPPPAATTLTVLNGNGIPGDAAAAGGLLRGRGYLVLPPPGQAPANAPSMSYPTTTIYFDASDRLAPAAAGALARLIRPAGVRPLPADPRLAALDPHSMLVVVLGRSFTGQLSAPPAAVREEAAAPAPAQAVQANVQPDGGATAALLAPLVHRVPFALETPSVVGSGSQPDAYGGDTPVRLYQITPGNKAVRLVYVAGGDQYWGIEETDWAAAPVLGDANLQRTLKGRTYDLYYANGHLHMVVLKDGGATYWVVNTLLDDLSNATMVAIAEGLDASPPGASHLAEAARAGRTPAGAAARARARPHPPGRALTGSLRRRAAAA